MQPSLSEPFHVPRSAARIIFDFAAMTACMKTQAGKVLDFGCGTGWMSELLARMGHEVVAYDVHPSVEQWVGDRIAADTRIPRDAITPVMGNGGVQMPFPDKSFGHILCFDTIHHITDYPAIFKEFVRVLAPGGRAVFVEPGAIHSKSAETVAFVKSQKQHDPSWIERDVVLDEMFLIAMRAGFSAFAVVPLPHPLVLPTYTAPQWKKFRAGDAAARALYCEHLAKINYDDRVVFYCDR